MLDRPRVRLLVDGWIVEGIPLSDEEAGRIADAGLLDPSGELVPPGPGRLYM